MQARRASKILSFLDPLFCIQLAAVGMPCLWLLQVSFRVWSGAESPHSYTMGNYGRILGDPVVRSALANNAYIILVAAALAVAVALPAALGGALRARLGLTAILISTIPAFISAPIRGEAWRNLAALLGLSDPAWVSIPAVASVSAPFAAVVLYLGFRRLRYHDVVLACTLGIPRYLAALRLWGGVLVRGAIAALSLACMLGLSDLTTPAELVRGSRYLIADELRGRMATQQWSQLAADAVVLGVASAICVVLAFSMSNRRSQPIDIEASRKHVSIAMSMLFFLPLGLLVLMPMVGLVAGSLSDSEVILSFVRGPTYRWWQSAASNGRLASASWLSARESLCATTSGVILGLASAGKRWHSTSGNQRSNPLCLAVWFLPWLVPPAALGITVALLSHMAGIPSTIWLTGVYHTLLVAPVAASFGLMCLSALPPADSGLAATLGIPSLTWYTKVLVPQVAVAIAASSAVGLAIVWTETQVAEFTCGLDETLPVMLKGIARAGGTPEISVVGTVGMMGGLLLISGVMIPFWRGRRQ